MKDYAAMKKWFYRCLAAACVFSASFLLMKPAVYMKGTGGSITVACLGLVFWLSLAAEIFCMIKAASVFNRNARSSKSAGDAKPLRPLKFFANRPAVVSDIVLIAAAAAAVLFAVIPLKAEYVYFVIVSALTLSISTHLLFNSNIYSFIEYIRESRGKMG